LFPVKDLLRKKKKKKDKRVEYGIFILFFSTNPLILDKLPLVQSKAILAAGTSKTE